MEKGIYTGIEAFKTLERENQKKLSADVIYVATLATVFTKVFFTIFNLKVGLCVSGSVYNKGTFSEIKKTFEKYLSYSQIHIKVCK